MFPFTKKLFIVCQLCCFFCVVSVSSQICFNSGSKERAIHSVKTFVIINRFSILWTQQALLNSELAELKYSWLHPWVSSCHIFLIISAFKYTVHVVSSQHTSGNLRITFYNNTCYIRNFDRWKPVINLIPVTSTNIFSGKFGLLVVSFWFTS